MRNWKKWAKFALIRAVKTIAQTAVASIGVALTLDDVNWLYVVNSSVLSGILSILTSLAGIPEEEELW